MRNLRPSNLKVSFQRPSCGSPTAVASGFIVGTAAVFRAVAEKQVTEGLDNFRVGMPNEFPAEDSAVDPDSYSLCEDRNVSSSVTLGMVITVECATSTDTFRYVIV